MFYAVVSESGTRAVTQQALEASAISRRDIWFAFEREAIAMCSEFSLGWCSCREIVEDAGFANDSVSENKLR